MNGRKKGKKKGKQKGRQSQYSRFTRMSAILLAAALTLTSSGFASFAEEMGEVAVETGTEREETEVSVLAEGQTRPEEQSVEEAGESYSEEQAPEEIGEQARPEDQDVPEIRPQTQEEGKAPEEAQVSPEGQRAAEEETPTGAEEQLFTEAEEQTNAGEQSSTEEDVTDQTEEESQNPDATETESLGEGSEDAPEEADPEVLRREEEAAEESMTEEVLKEGEPDGTDSEPTEKILASQTLTAAIYTDEDYTAVLPDGTSIILSGVMPEGAEAKAYPVGVVIEDVKILAAYDITIFDAEGQEYQPEEGALEVRIENQAIREALAEEASLTVYHMEQAEDCPEEIAVIAPEAETVQFSAEQFSIYVVGENVYTYAGSGEEASIYTFYFTEYLWSDQGSGTVVSVQTVAENDCLDEPVAPEVEHHIFDGWYTEKQDEDSGEHDGHQFDFGRTVKENLAGWDDYTPLREDGRYVVFLYSDFEPAFYVYFMSEEDPVLNADPDYVPYVLYTGKYNEKDSILDTRYASSIYGNVFLNTGYTVTSWYYISGTRKIPVQEGMQVTDDLVLYPNVDSVIWIYFDMGGASSTEVTAIEPVYVLSEATSVGTALPDDPVRAGYQFEGWFADAACQGDPVTADSDPGSLADENRTVTLYAKWTESKAAYIVNFWRQKQGSSVGAKGSDFGYYANEYDLVLTEYVKEDDKNALITGSAVSAVQDVPDWEEWTSYDEAALTADEKYFGFEYARERTESELHNSGRTISGDGSTIINIYYDRVTITWNFWNVEYDQRNETNARVVYTLTGLWGAELASGDWPSVNITENYKDSWIWCHYQNGGKTEYRFDTSYKYLPAGNKAKADCDFFLDSITDGGTLYIYKEVLEPVQGDNGWEHTDTAGNTQYYELFTSAMLNAGVSYGISEKFDTHYAAHAINSISDKSDEWQDISTNGGTERPFLSVDTDEDQVIRLFYDLNDYDVILYSNGETYRTATYKYSEPVKSLPGKEELSSAVEENETLRPNYYYEFTGWSSADGSTIQVSAPDVMPGYDLTYYAIWELKRVNVRFHSGVEDGSVTNMAVNQNILATQCAAEPEEPHREGYVFVGWQTSSGKYFDFSTVLYDDIDLTAIWFTANTGHKLTYVVDIDGRFYSYTNPVPFVEGSRELVFTIEDVLEEINKKYDLDLSEERMAELGGEFLCWNSEAAGNGVKYYPDSEYTFDVSDGMIFAQWISEKTAVLVLDYNYPEGYMPAEDGNPSAAIGEDPLHPRTSVSTENLENIALGAICELNKTTVTVDGRTYTFSGWALSADAAEAAIGSEEKVAVDTLNLNGENENVLYAVWTALEVRVDILVQKIVDGREWLEEDSFRFALTEEEGNGKVVTVTSGDAPDYTRAFDSFVYTAEGEHLYTITEIVPDQKDADMDYDSRSVTVKVTVTEDDGELTAAVSYGDDETADAAVFTNTYRKNPEKKVSVDSESGQDGAEVEVGDLITYEIAYYNYHSEASAVTITDVLDDGLNFVSAADGGIYDEATHTITWTIGEVPAFAEGSVSFTGEVNANAWICDEVKNIASVRIGEDAAVETNEVENPVDDPKDPGKTEVTVGDGGEVQVGDELIYRITYKNEHSARAVVTITDVLEDGLDYVLAPGGDYDGTSRTVTWVIEDVEAYAEGSVFLIAKVNEKALVTDRVTNTAAVQVGDRQAVVTDPVINPVMDPEDPIKTVNPEDGSEVVIGEELTYTISYKNGHSEPVSVTITDVLDVGLDFVSATSGGSYDEATRIITWEIGEVGAYTKDSVSFTAVVNRDAVVKKEVDNTASVQIGDDPTVSTNKVENPVNDPEEPAKGVDVGEGTEVKVGDELIYSITYRNGHNMPAEVRVTDALDHGVDFVSASAGGIYDEETHTVTWILQEVTAHAGGSVWVAVRVNEDSLLLDEVTNQAEVQIENDPAVKTNPVVNPVEDPEEPTKSVDVGEGTEVKAGEELTYTITYRNGHSEPADVTITDELKDGLDFICALDGGTYEEETRTITWIIPDVQPYSEGSVTFKAAVNENAVDIIENTARVQCADDPAVDTNTVTNIVEPAQDPGEPGNPPLEPIPGSGEPEPGEPEPGEPEPKTEPESETDTEEGKGTDDENASAKDSSPKTSDETPLAFMLVMGMLALVTISGSGFYRRRRHNEKR